ncbi:MAG: TIGR04348 family glycosyltransferase [Planctomycetes bacterium]|nr:TIGR04348 family glycosyltransferase [Planctomycetota bacterium]
MSTNVALPTSVVIVTPAPRRSSAGNRVTALRWAGLLRQLGIRVRVTTEWRGPEPRADVLLAVHATRSVPSVLAFAAARPTAGIAILLAGTDIYPDFTPDAATMRALERADALIALQPRAIEVLPPALRGKARTIVQSATALPAVRRTDAFVACVLAHLRPIKDPLLPFEALALLPRGLAIEIAVAGRALGDDLATRATAATRTDPRARWLGELSRPAARRLLAASHACIVPSTGEGGANVVSEAIAAGTPILATRIPGNTGLLGDDWPALFPPRDAAGLATLLSTFATDPRSYQALVDRTIALQHLVQPAREREALRRLLTDLFPR